jgi:hypothetical protein
MKESLSVILMLTAFCALGQQPQTVHFKLGNSAVIFIDSVNVDKNEMLKYKPDDIALVTVFHDSAAIKLIGPDGKDGVVYIETKAFARRRYWSLFSSKSAEYARIVPTPGGDSSVQYILNNRILVKNFEGDLALIKDSTFKTITILDKKTLQSQYNISNKEYGVLVEVSRPPNASGINL